MIPKPGAYNDWKTWAAAVTSSLEKPSKQGGRVTPDAILLASLMKAEAGNLSTETAAVDGLLMFDPVAGVPVFSLNGAWETLVKYVAPTEKSYRGTVNHTVAGKDDVIAFPAPFSAAPHVTATLVGDQGEDLYSVSVHSVTASGFKLRVKKYADLYSNTVSDAAFTVNWRAEGSI